MQSNEGGTVIRKENDHNFEKGGWTKSLITICLIPQMRGVNMQDQVAVAGMSRLTAEVFSVVFICIYRHTH